MSTVEVALAAFGAEVVVLAAAFTGAFALTVVFDVCFLEEVAIKNSSLTPLVYLIITKRKNLFILKVLHNIKPKFSFFLEQPLNFQIIVPY